MWRITKPSNIKYGTTMMIPGEIDIRRAAATDRSWADSPQCSTMYACSSECFKQVRHIKEHEVHSTVCWILQQAVHLKNGKYG
jgi:hypothetical protein